MGWGLRAERQAWELRKRECESPNSVVRASGVSCLHAHHNGPCKDKSSAAKSVTVLCRWLLKDEQSQQRQYCQQQFLISKV